MTHSCKCCGETFPLSKDTIELIEQGFISRQDLPDSCQDCAQEYWHEEHEYSDADAGL